MWMSVWQVMAADRQQASVSTLLGRTTANVMTALLETINDSLATVHTHSYIRKTEDNYQLT